MDQRNQTVRTTFLIGLAFLFLCSQNSRAESRQENRFSEHIEAIQKILNQPKPEQLLSEFVKKEGRAQLFSLEALLRVYASEHPEELGKFLTHSIKPFEDELGRWVDAQDAVAFAKKVGASEKVISYLQGQADNQRQHFLIFLEEKHFWGRETTRSPLQRLSQTVEELDWEGKHADRKLVLKSLRKTLKSLQKKDYDMHKLEAGIHEFRRDLRWIPIYLRSFNDLIQLDERPLKEARLSPDDPIFKSPYSKIKSTQEPVSFPILFPRLGLLSLNKSVWELGKAKDSGKMEELFTKALQQTGEIPSRTRAQKQAKEWVKQHPDYSPTILTASSIYRALTHPEQGLVAALRPMLKEQKHWSKQDCKSFLKTLNHR